MPTIVLNIDTEKSLSMEEARDLDIQSKHEGVPPHELVVDFIREGLRRRRETAPTAPTSAVVVDRTRA